MARGSLRAATHNAYRGAAGSTRQAAIHVTLPSGEVASVLVYTGIDVAADAELGQRLLSEDPARALNAVRLPDGSALVVTTPVVYHDPANELMVLVLADGDRHRELAERARLLHEMAADPATGVPGYARDFGVVFGSRGLRSYLEDKAEKAVAASRAGELERELERERSAGERRRTEVAAQTAELEKIRVDLERRSKELERRAADLEKRVAELDAERGLLDRARLELDRIRNAEPPVRPTRLATAQRAVTATGDEASTGPFDLADDIDTASQPVLAPRARTASTAAVTLPITPTPAIEHADEDTVQGPPPELPPGSDPLTTTTAETATNGAVDGWLEAFVAGNSTSIAATDEQGVRLAMRVPPASAQALGRGPLDVRIQLHRTPHYPVVTITVGTPLALRGAADHRVSAVLDVSADVDRKAMATLSKRFVLTVELIADRKRLRRIVLTAPLEENAAYVTRAAQDHLRTLSAEAQSQGTPSLSRARQLLADPGYDALGAHHPEAGEFRDDKLGQLATANQVRRALAVARRFTRPSCEDYLVTVRGYPLARWHERRRGVLVRAVDWGLWMGTDLAQVAVSEALARSRKDLVARLELAFSALLGDAAANDLDGDAAEDNRKALIEEARQLGLPGPGGARGEAPAPRTVASNDEPVASGTIERRAVTVDPRARSLEELIALIDDRQHRLGAALELCERGDARAIRPVLNAVRRMGRAEAVRVLGAMVKFGDAAAPALTAGLGSSKAFLRHGCALALGLLRTEAGTEAVIDLLLSEPTEIWRELARSVGQIGPTALMPLAARMGRLGDRATPATRERVAWAMAHMGVRGGRTAVETLAGGQSVVAPVARSALDLMAPAARDDLRGTGTGREVTVNRAFSRKFFEALGQGGLAKVAHAELEALDASGPMELLDEADLLDIEGEADDAAELDESDLIEG